MKRYTSYIVDDEPLAVRLLKKKLESFPEIDLVGDSTRMAKAIKDITLLKPEILFLDIQLAEGTGFDLLNKLEYTGKVIFVTAYEEYALRAFEVNALDYLLKPISIERLQSALERFKLRTHSNFIPEVSDFVRYKYSDRIMAYDKNQIRFVLLDSIIIISAARDYTTIETLEGKIILMTRTMSEWEERLPQEHFVRIHRSHIVNINLIDRILRYSTTSAKVYVRNHVEPFTLSRNYYKNLKDRYL